MIKFFISIISLQIFLCISNGFVLSSTYLSAETVNIKCAIRDSLSHDSIPVVKVTIQNLGKSFKTTRSGFIAALESGPYDFLLEADEYESFKKTITLSTENNEFTFEMVQVADRTRLKAKQDTFKLYLLSFENALVIKDLFEAERLITLIESFDIGYVDFDSIHRAYELAKIACIDSFLNLAQVLEDSLMFVDAYFYIQQVVEIDSLNEVAVEKLDMINKKIKAAAQKSDQSSSGTKPRMTPEAIEKMYKDGVAKFLAEDYAGALRLFKAVRTNDPAHEGAETYLRRAKARLKALED